MSGIKFKALWDYLSLSGGELISKIVGFLAFAYLARVLDPEHYGYVELAVGLLVFFTHMVEFGFGVVGARQIANFPRESAHCSGLIITARALLALIFVPLMCLVAPFMTQSNEAVTLIVIYAFALLPMPLNQRWLLQGMDKMVLVSLGQLMRMLIFAIGVVLFVKGPQDLLNVGYVEIAAVMAMLLYFLSAQRRFDIPVRPVLKFRELIALGKQAAAIGLSEGVWAFNQYVPLLMVANFGGAAQVAWFGAALRIVTSLGSFSALYYFNLYPVLSRRFKISRESLLELVQPSSRVTAWVGIFIAVTITVYAQSITQTVFGGEFRRSGDSLAVLIWALPMNLLSGHARWVLVAAHKQRYLFYAHLSALATTLTGGLLLIPEYGALGASWTIVLATAVVWLVAHIHACRVVVRLPFLDAGIPALTAALVLGLSFIETESGWYRNLLFLALYVAVAMLVDRRVPRDVRTLLYIKNIDQPVTSPQAKR